MEAEWNIAVGDAYTDSTEAFVAKATCEDGTPAVLKLLVPRAGDAAENEITVLRLTRGEGLRALAARRRDARRALARTSRPLALRARTAASADVTRSSARRSRASGDPHPTAACRPAPQKGRWLADFIAATWEELDHPCSERAVDHAIACAARRVDAHRDERAVLVHGDVHQWNALEADDGFKLVDPDGLLAEPEYDLGIIMREDPLDISDNDPHERARWLAAHTGLDATSIWEWGVVERVSTGLLGTKVGLQPVARQMLAVADRLAAS